LKFNLLKAIKNTHRHPINIILHCIGLSLYINGIYFIILYFMNQNIPILYGIVLWLCAISLFILGHKIEGNLRAITLVIIYKYLRSFLQNQNRFRYDK
jgi:type IV secretory pathway TrbD component